MLTEVAEAIGTQRFELSGFRKHPDYNAATEHLDRLCKLFGCTLNDHLAQFWPEDTDLVLD